jgi:hypothetical protein
LFFISVAVDICAKFACLPRRVLRGESKRPLQSRAKSQAITPVVSTTGLWLPGVHAQWHTPTAPQQQQARHSVEGTGPARPLRRSWHVLFHVHITVAILGHAEKADFAVFRCQAATSPENLSTGLIHCHTHTHTHTHTRVIEYEERRSTLTTTQSPMHLRVRDKSKGVFACTLSICMLNSPVFEHFAKSGTPCPNTWTSLGTVIGAQAKARPNSFGFWECRLIHLPASALL